MASIGRRRLIGGMAAALPAGRARPADLKSIRFGKAIASSFPFAGLELGKEQGIWAAAGLDPVISAFRGDGQMQQALAAGSIDFGLGSGPAMGYAAKGVPARAVAVVGRQPQNMGLVVAKNSGIASLADLKDKKIGVTTAGSLTDWLARNIASSRGWPQDAVDVVPMGEIRTRLLAMQAGELGGAVTAIQEAYQIQDSGEGTVLTTFGAVVPDFITHVIFAKTSIIQNNPALVRSVLQGWFRVAAFMRDHRAETVKSIAATMKVPEKIIDETYPDEMAMISFDGVFDPRALAVIQKSLVDLGIVDSTPALLDLYTDQFVPVSIA